MVVIKNLLIGLRNESVISKIRTESETGEEALKVRFLRCKSL